MIARSRFGTFFLAIGVVLVFLFIFSDVAGQPIFIYFCGGVVCALLGVILWWSSPPGPPSQPPERFRTLRKYLDRSKSKKK
jgi:hypothetical protein